jgi:hypothetical protein
MRFFSVQLRLGLLGVVSVLVGVTAIVLLITAPNFGDVGLLGLAALLAFGARSVYHYASEFREVWLNDDRLELRRGDEVESVPLAAVRKIDYRRFDSREAASVTLQIASRADTVREVRFFPADVSMTADILAFFDGGLRFKKSSIVEELRTLVLTARECHAHPGPLLR